MNELEIGWENGYGEKLDEQGFGVFGDSLINEEKMYSKYFNDNLIDCSEFGDKVIIDGVEKTIVDDEIRVDYGINRFNDSFTQEEIDSFRSK
jgi:hypothetical protein